MSKNDQMILRRRRTKFEHSNSTPPAQINSITQNKDELASEIEENLIEPTTSSNFEYLKETPLLKQTSPIKKSLDVNKRLNIFLEPDPVELIAEPSLATPLIVATGNQDSKQRFQKSTTTKEIPYENIPKEDGGARFWLPNKMGMFEFVWMELTRGYSLQNDEDRYTEKRKKVHAFIKVPFELEKFLFFGFLQCLDAFCHVFTFLPIRIIMNFFGCLFRLKFWTVADTCDILKVVIIAVSSYFMLFVDFSVIYHVVRGQSAIKLYIFYNMLEVADKLFSSFGQDILDTLLLSASERKSKREKVIPTLLNLALAIFYALCHTILVLLQTTALNVAFNSSSQQLLTIIMSNNFVELKGAVFKKFAKPNLFQMSCSDVRERFHITILLIVVVLRNLTAFNWKLDTLTEMAPDLTMVVVAEFLVDWLKHAFITKFNEINAEVYLDFRITLAFDVVRSHDKNSFSDFSDQVSRRMGFIPIPISIMLIRVIGQSVDFSKSYYIPEFLLLWLLCCLVKILTGIYLHRKAVDFVLHYRKLQRETNSAEENIRKMLCTKKAKSAPGSPRLSLIDFSDVLTQATNGPSKGFTASDMLAQWDDLITPGSIRRREPSGCTNIILRNSSSSTTQPNGTGGGIGPILTTTTTNTSTNLSIVTEPKTPEINGGVRRSQSLLDLVETLQRREKSLPAVINEASTIIENPSSPKIIVGGGGGGTGGIVEAGGECKESPVKHRIPLDCESLSTVQAYTLLNAQANVQDIQS